MTDYLCAVTAGDTQKAPCITYARHGSDSPVTIDEPCNASSTEPLMAPNQVLNEDSTGFTHSPNSAFAPFKLVTKIHSGKNWKLNPRHGAPTSPATMPYKELTKTKQYEDSKNENLSHSPREAFGHAKKHKTSHMKTPPITILGPPRVPVLTQPEDLHLIEFVERLNNLWTEDSEDIISSKEFLTDITSRFKLFDGNCDFAGYQDMYQKHMIRHGVVEAVHKYLFPKWKTTLQQVQMQTGRILSPATLPNATWTSQNLSDTEEETSNDNEDPFKGTTPPKPSSDHCTCQGEDFFEETFKDYSHLWTKRSSSNKSPPPVIAYAMAAQADTKPVANSFQQPAEDIFTRMQTRANNNSESSNQITPDQQEILDRYNTSGRTLPVNPTPSHRY
jgi:hypothetical protein